MRKVDGMSDDQTPSTESAGSEEESGGKRRKRTPRTFPASSFVEALPLAEAIHKFAAGQKVRRITLFDQMNRSPESGTSRQLITNSSQYGLTTGSYTAEYLELTPTGALASGVEANERAQVAARLQLAIEQVEPFQNLYEAFKDNRLPANSILRDHAIENGMSEDHADECVETFLANARDLGVVDTVAGAERMLSFEMVLDHANGEGTDEHDSAAGPDEAPGAGPPTGPVSPTALAASVTDLTDVCFIISPIGSSGSDERKHADLVLGSLIEPALAELGLRPVRADKISKPGLITAQVIDHLVKAPLVLADLSFGNANVFYELALRHATRRPTVQIVRSSDPLPFDVGQFRTVVIDMTDIYSLVPALDRHRAEIARQCRTAIEGDGPADSPLSLFYPSFWNGLAEVPAQD